MIVPLLLLKLLQDPAQDSAGAARVEPIPLSLRVNHGIALGVDFLKSLQQADGSFPGYEVQHPGGATALVAYTLARSGARKNDPALLAALSALEETEFASVYSASVHLLLCEALHEPEREQEAQRSLDFLLEHQDQGVWAYPWGHLCNSNTQFALLALRAARRMGLEVPEGVLVEALDGLDVFRHASGGSLYAPGQNETYAGMTAATLASLGVLQEASKDSPRLRAALAREERDRQRAEAWLEERFDPARNLHGDGSWRTTWHFAYLWAVERWCGLTGRERIAGRDWYAEGAEWLLAAQRGDGGFGGDGGLEDTCFALLFLRRATVSPDEELAEIYAEIERLRAARPRLRRSPSREARRMTEWWLAGPWPQSGDDPILLDPPFDPAKVRPRAHGKLARSEWTVVSLEKDSWCDLEQLVEREGNRQLWVLSTWLSAHPPSESEVVEARLWLELEEGWDLWLDGERLSRERRRSLPIVPDASWPLRLARGEHLLTILVEDRRGPSAFGALLTGPNGGPPVGLFERAEPPEER